MMMATAAAATNTTKCYKVSYLTDIPKKEDRLRGREKQLWENREEDSCCYVDHC